MAVRERWKGTKRIGLSTSECVDLLLPATVRDVRVDAVYLFGSRAAGVGHADSDVDLAIQGDVVLVHAAAGLTAGDDPAEDAGVLRHPFTAPRR